MQRESLNFILQYADSEQLNAIINLIKNKHNIDILQPPTQQTLMLPVKDPISGGEFYAGEVLVTTSLICMYIGENRVQGWAMVLDDDKELSLQIAIIDGYYGFYENREDNIKSSIIELVMQTNEQKESRQKRINQEIDSTRVNFELM